jgi:drug/metabolite transporter (DMT)-like permease
MLALALALSASLCWGVSDFVGGLQARHVSLLRVMLVSETLGLGALIVVLAVRGTAAPSFARLLPALLGGLAGTVALAGFYRALAIGTMSIVAPISATGAAVPVVVGLAGGDRPASRQLVGIAAAMVGVVLASRERGPGIPERPPSPASIALALVAAAGFGTFFVAIRSSARADVLWALFAARASSVAALMAIVAVRSPARVLGRERFWPIAAVGMLDLAANGLYAFATRHGLLSVVAVGASLYPLATVVLARVVLGERVRRVQELGITAALLGVALIASG